MICRVENELLQSTGLEGDFLAHLDVLAGKTVWFDADNGFGSHWFSRGIFTVKPDLQCGRIVCWAERNKRRRIADRNCSSSLQPDMLPDAHIPVTRCCNPIPANGAVLGDIAKYLGIAAI